MAKRKWPQRKVRGFVPQMNLRSGTPEKQQEQVIPSAPFKHSQHHPKAFFFSQRNNGLFSTHGKAQTVIAFHLQKLFLSPYSVSQKKRRKNLKRKKFKKKKNLKRKHLKRGYFGELSVPLKGQKAIFIPVLFSPIGWGGGEGKVLKGICLFLKTPKWTSHSLSLPILAIPVNKRKRLR